MKRSLNEVAFWLIFLLIGLLSLWIMESRWSLMMVHMESMDFFVWTDDYLRMKLAEYPGFTSLLTDFLLQFFRWQGVGSSVMVLLMLATVCMLRLVRRCLGTGVYGMEFLLPVLLLCVVPFSLSVHLTALFFTISLWLLLRWRHVMVWLLWIIVAPWLLVGSLQLMVVLLAAFGCLRCHSVGKYNLLARVLTSVVLAIVSVYAFNEWLGYIPFENRWWCAPAEELNVWMFHLLFLLASQTQDTISYSSGMHSCSHTFPGGYIRMETPTGSVADGCMGRTE